MSAESLPAMLPGYVRVYIPPYYTTLGVCTGGVYMPPRVPATCVLPYSTPVDTANSIDACLLGPASGVASRCCPLP